jgi:hypothetical protein
MQETIILPAKKVELTLLKQSNGGCNQQKDGVSTLWCFKMLGLINEEHTRHQFGNALIYVPG